MSRWSEYSRFLLSCTTWLILIFKILQLVDLSLSSIIIRCPGWMAVELTPQQLCKWWTKCFKTWFRICRSNVSETIPHFDLCHVIFLISWLDYNIYIVESWPFFCICLTQRLCRCNYISSQTACLFNQGSQSVRICLQHPRRRSWRLHPDQMCLRRNRKLVNEI